jgi:adenylate cyclase
VNISSIVAFGTRQYPEKVARRLRVVNVICWFGAAMLYLVALRRLVEGVPGNPGLEAAIGATILASIPLLHRFGSAAAISVLIVFVFLDTWRLNVAEGTGGGFWLVFLTGGAFAILILGGERPILCALLAIVSVASAIFAQLYLPFTTGVEAPDALFLTLLVNIGRTGVLLFAVVFFGARQIARAEAAVEVERDRSDRLLTNILPAAIADRLKLQPETKIADRYDEASVLFADMAGFTRLADTMAPDELVRFLDGVFSTFDRLVETHGLEKIKTSGDAYMAVSGVPLHRPDHAQALARLAADMLLAAERFEHGVKIRIGIASGPLVAGVVGSRKFFYDVWGDAVNLAARMEQTGETGRIHVSRETARLLEGALPLEPRGRVNVKGKGEIETFFIGGGSEPASRSSQLPH